MANRLHSFRGQGQWQGFTRLNVNDRGQSRLLKLENGYVSTDGSEIRSMPGWCTILDLTDENNQLGYGRLTKDIVKPIYATSPAEPYQYKEVNASTLLSQDVLAKKTHLHAFEQCMGQTIVIGETRFREYPIGASGGGTVLPLSVFRDSGTNRWTFNFSGTIATTGTLTDAAGVGLDYTTTDSVVYCEGLATANATVNTWLDTNVNARTHALTALSGNVMTLMTTANAAVSTSGVALTAGTVRKVMPNWDNVYLTSAGFDPYKAPPLRRPYDPDALTIWRAVGALSLGEPEKSCLVAYVANRQRDVGDRTTTNIVDGWFPTANPGRGHTRRSMRKLPYRVCPEPSSDRIILAAPGYGCMFQIPVRVPINDAFPPGATTTGIVAPSNGLRDKPRALGIPKARMLEPVYMAGSQSTITGIENKLTEGRSWVVLGNRSGSVFTPFLAVGTWKMCVTYFDVATGEEGPPSEIVQVNLASLGGNGGSLLLNVYHPGYVMGECLATHMRVYIANPGSEVLKYYMTAPIDFAAQSNFGAPDAHVYYQSGSSEYGLYGPGSPIYANQMFCHFFVPWPADGSELIDALNENIQPRVVNMPRGASSARFVRGVLLSGGAIGNYGECNSLWQAKASAATGWEGESHFRPDELHIRTYGTNVSQSSSMDGSPLSSVLGIAGRCFPDAYQGVEVIAPTLLPAGFDRAQVDFVANRRQSQLRFAVHDAVVATPTLGGYGSNLSPAPANNTEGNYERLRLVRKWAEDMRAVGLSVTSPALSVFTRTDQDVFFVMPQGQLQVGDPSAPQYASKSSIKIFDSTAGEDITAIGRLASMAYVCSRKETYSLTWYRSAIGEELNLVSNEHGCIAANSMVEFDGGLAWLGERGPVAVSSAGVDFVGASIADDFYGTGRRYLSDSQGMMRHAWGCHDQSRGLVLWGLVTKNHTHTVTDEFTTYSFESATPDGVLSRFPCDEILVWSYRANAFSTWRMPSGMEVLWARPMRDELGSVRVCFLAADGRIYAFDDEWNDRNGSIADYGYTSDAVTGNATFAVTGPGSSQTALSLTGANVIVDGDYLLGSIGTRNAGLLVAPGQNLEIVDAYGNVTHRTTVASITSYSESGGTTVLEMSAAATWGRDATVRVGSRPAMTIVTTFTDTFAMENGSVDGVQLRFGLLGDGHANVKATLIKPEIARSGIAADVQTKQIDANMDPTRWIALGRNRTDLDDTGRQLGMRATIPARATGPEIALKLEITGTPQIRIQDVSLEVA